MSKKSYIETREVDDVTIIVKIFAPNKKLMGEQQLQDLFSRDLFPLVEERGKKKLALDLSEIDDMSSVARGKLISLYKKVIRVNGKLVTFGCTKVVLEVFQILKLDRTLTTVADEQTALVEMAKPIEIKPAEICKYQKSESPAVIPTMQEILFVLEHPENTSPNGEHVKQYLRTRPGLENNLREILRLS